ncbi:MAG: hypothetical protein MUC74_16040, partial [Ideonella sp.]|nr:hypothetical protein [Ideonella sp.]
MIGAGSPSLRARLTLTALGTLTLVLAAGAWGLSAAFSAAVERGFDERLKTVLQTLVAEAEFAPDGSLTLGRPIGDPRFDQIYSGSYWQVSNAQGVLLRSRSLWDQEIPFNVATPDGSTLFREWTNPAGQSVRLAERDLTLPGGPDVLHFIVAGRTTEIEAELRRFDQLLALGVAGLVLALGAAIALQVRIGLRPLRVLLDDLEAVWQGRRRRVDETLPPDLQPVASAVNQLLDHDDREIVRARDQAADLAHAIKTPLAVLRADLERLDSPLASDMRDRLDLIDGLVRRNLARAAPARANALHTLGAAVRPVAERMAGLPRPGDRGRAGGARRDPRAARPAGPRGAARQPARQRMEVGAQPRAGQRGGARSVVPARDRGRRSGARAGRPRGGAGTPCQARRTDAGPGPGPADCPGHRGGRPWHAGVGDLGGRGARGHAGVAARAAGLRAQPWPGPRLAGAARALGAIGHRLRCVLDKRPSRHGPGGAAPH